MKTHETIALLSVALIAAGALCIESCQKNDPGPVLAASGPPIPTNPYDAGSLLTNAGSGQPNTWRPYTDSGLSFPSGWQTAFNCNLTTQTTQSTWSTDGFETVCGVQGWILNMGHTNSSGWTLTNGTGLIANAGSAQQDSTNQPAFLWSINSIMSSVGVTWALLMPMRVTVCMSWNATSETNGGPQGVVAATSQVDAAIADGLWGSAFGLYNGGSGNLAIANNGGYGHSPFDGQNVEEAWGGQTSCFMQSWPAGVMGGPTVISASDAGSNPAEQSWGPYAWAWTPNGAQSSSTQPWYGQPQTVFSGSTGAGFTSTWYTGMQMSTILSSKSATFTQFVVQYQALP